jgi:hypothetical protein
MSANSVSQIVAGSNVTITPPSGTGAVTINSSASAGTVNNLTNARVPYSQPQETSPGGFPSNGVNGVIGVTCPVGSVTTGGFATFSFCVNNGSTTDAMNINFGMFTGPNTPPIPASAFFGYYRATGIPPGAKAVISRTFPIVNMTGNFVVQGYVIQNGDVPAPAGQLIENPVLSVTWGGTATVSNAGP